MTRLAATLSEKDRRELLARVQRIRSKAGVTEGAPEVAGARVFISYAHDSDQHLDDVRTLWYLLRSLGVDARLDRPPTQRRDDWPEWLRDEVNAAGLVLVVASPVYRETKSDTTGSGGLSGLPMLEIELVAHRVLGVVLPGRSVQDLPALLRGSERVVVEELSAAGVETLVRMLILRASKPEPRAVTSPLWGNLLVGSDRQVDLLAASDLGRLAHAVREQWHSAAAARRLGSPRLPVRWSATTRPVAARSSQPVAEHWIDGRSTLMLSGIERGISDLFFQLPRLQLVVLGEPGSGKTIAMITLVLEMLSVRSQQDPVPILLSLASWQPHREPFDSWFNRNISENYGLRAKRARRLVEMGLVIPILDGLDEIPLELRGFAIQALERGFVDRPLVVACRADEYEQAVFETGHMLAGAAVIELQPLALDDVIRYLADMLPINDQRWESLFDDLRSGPDQSLAQVLTRPIMVDLLWIAYSATRTDPTELLDESRFPLSRSIEEHLLDTLIPGSFGEWEPWHSESAWYRFDPDLAKKWFSYLAYGMDSLRTVDLAWWELHRLVPKSIGRLFFWLVCFGVSATASSVGFLLHEPVRTQPWGGVIALGVAASASSLFLFGSRPSRLPSRLVLSGRLLRTRWRFPMSLREAQSPRQVLQADRTATWVSSIILAVVAVAVEVVVVSTGSISAFGSILLLGIVPLVVMLPIARGAWGWFVFARLWLALHGNLPIRLMSFLDAALERGIFRQVGSVYQFRHRQLHRHLSAQLLHDMSRSR